MISSDIGPRGGGGFLNRSIFKRAMDLWISPRITLLPPACNMPREIFGGN